ncbi:diphthine synthase [Starmerella bacillaris]|uniref:diphthine methyl ester synthase n=1 Tax=Starmerella bacillaris TaxID=1247836 RepID=A0AAV5RDB0_STABA|nr:diphthine synthase [Starmerella bacillaris]
MLHLIGLGLSDPTDVTVKGLEIIKKCKRVYLEAYTSILMAASTESLEEFYGCKVLLADRELVESGSEEILEGADKDCDVAFLVVGDPFGATTHTDLVLRAREKNIEVNIVHNASVMNAVGCTGLQLYNFGQTVSMVFFTETWRPDSFYDKIKENRRIGLHTLVLLDIKVKEQTLQNLLRGNDIYEPPRFMSIEQAAEQLIEVQENRKEKNYEADTPCIAVSRLGSPRQVIRAGTLKEMAEYESGEPLHSLIILGHRIHDLESDYFMQWAFNKDTLKKSLEDDQKYTYE